MEEVKLNITSMMDMFTIILVFLLFSFSTQDQNVVIEKDLTLPVSTSELDVKWSINVTLTKDELRVDKNVIANIKDNEFISAKVEGNKILPLYNVLEKYKNIDEFEKVTENNDRNKILLFQIDKDVSYKILNKVLKTSGMAGYPDFRFIVQKK